MTHQIRKRGDSYLEHVMQDQEYPVFKIKLQTVPGKFLK